MPGLGELPIESVSVLAPVYAVAAVLLLLLALPFGGLRRPWRHRTAIVAAAAGVGALLGSLLVVWVVDVQDVFGVAASPVIRGAAALGGAAVAVAAVNLLRTRVPRKVVALLAIPVLVAAAALVVNRDVAYYPRLGDVFGDTGVGSLVLDRDAGDSRSLASWRPPADMPSTGTVGTVDIPGTESRWRAREAWVYLPPAARTAHPPRLPVIVAMSGQPGSPSDVFLAGGLQTELDAVARAHRGVAPIVVVPDQLGSSAANPMCVDSALGDVATYITVDVRGWILRHLPVSSSRTEWTVAGFSQGGTCAAQFGSEHPAIFGSFIAASPEIGPTNGSVAHTIAVGFHGSRAAYEAAQPIAIMRRAGRYRDTAAVYTVGELDGRYAQDAGRLAAVSREVGMRTSYRSFPDLAHNWNTGAAGLAFGIDRLVDRWRLP